MKAYDRHQWVLQWLRSQPPYDARVDVLNAPFVLAYLTATQTPFAAMPYGAHKCPQLGRDLAAMFSAGQLVRGRVGMGPGARNQGFPAWVYVYSLG